MRFLVMALLLLGHMQTTVLYDDQFHTTHSLAQYQFCYRWGCAAPWNGELEHYTQANISVTNGKLDLRAIHTSGGYTSGMVTTAGHFAFEYGVIEARMQLPSGQGLWPAMWLLAANGQSTTELDVVEMLGEAPNVLHSGVHWKVNGQHKHKGVSYSGPDLSQGYHLYRVEWRPDHITWAIDGVTYYTTTDAASIPHTALYLIMNLAVGGTWPGAPNGSTPFPSDMLVDWVTVQA